MERLSGWLLGESGAAITGSETLVSSLDTWFGQSLGTSWRGDDEHGLARALDLTPGWEGWDNWDAAAKENRLRQVIEFPRWRAVLIPPGDELASRLTSLWSGNSWRGDDDQGLARALDQLSGWHGWDIPDLTVDTLRGWLTPFPAEWTGVSADSADSAQEDLSEPHVDETLNPPRWRRWVAEDQEFEHYNNTDEVWERLRGAYWHRYHSDPFGWLPYHEESQTWLDPAAGNPEWRRYENVGKPEPDPLSSPAARLASYRQRALSEAVAQIRAAGVSEAEVSDEQVALLLDQSVLKALRARQ